jgi:hypothetical protein
MAKRRSSKPNTLSAGLAASVLASSVTIAIGLCVLHDVSEQCQDLERHYLHRGQIARLAAEELARTGSTLRSWQPRGDERDPLDAKAHLERMVRAVHSYGALGELREEEAAQISVVVHALDDYRQALGAASASEADASAVLKLDAVAQTNAAAGRAFDHLAAIAGQQASASGGVVSTIASNISNIYLLIAGLGILAGIPPAVWVIHLLQLGSRRRAPAFPRRFGAPVF